MALIAIVIRTDIFRSFAGNGIGYESPQRTRLHLNTLCNMFKKNIVTFFPLADLRCRRVLPGDHVDVGRSCRVCLFQLLLELANRRFPNT